MNCSNKTVKNKVFFAVLVLQFIVILACITGALLAKRGNRGILREARDEGRRKKYFCEIFFSSLVSPFALVSLFAENTAAAWLGS